MKSIFTQVLKIICVSLTYCPLIIFAEHVVVEHPAGETYSLQVDQEDRFLDVIHSIYSFSGDRSLGLEENNNDQNLLTFKIRQVSRFENLSKKIRALPRNYAADLAPSEAADIGYIVKTLANSSLPKIKSAESSLKKAGDRIDHIHPFHFLTCVFTSEELKVCLRNLQGRTWVWKDFLNGITETLSQEDAKGNLLPFVNDFSEKIKVDANVIVPILQAGRWERFVNTLIEIVPRGGGADRYNI